MKVFDLAMLDSVSAAAKVSPRIRSHHNLHADYGEPVQRLLNAVEPGTYVRPHRHLGDGKWELFAILRGAVAVVIFDEQGVIIRRTGMQAGGPVYGVEIPASAWHTLVPLAADTVLLEVKQGPFDPNEAKYFPEWAPEEGSEAAQGYAEWLRVAEVGEQGPREE